MLIDFNKLRLIGSCETSSIISIILLMVSPLEYPEKYHKLVTDILKIEDLPVLWTVIKLLRSFLKQLFKFDH